MLWRAEWAPLTHHMHSPRRNNFAPLSPAFAHRGLFTQPLASCLLVNLLGQAFLTFTLFVTHRPLGRMFFVRPAFASLTFDVLITAALLRLALHAPPGCMSCTCPRDAAPEGGFDVVHPLLFQCSAVHYCISGFGFPYSQTADLYSIAALCCWCHS